MLFDKWYDNVSFDIVGDLVAMASLTRIITHTRAPLYAIPYIFLIIRLSVGSGIHITMIPNGYNILTDLLIVAIVSCGNQCFHDSATELYSHEMAFLSSIKGGGKLCRNS